MTWEMDSWSTTSVKTLASAYFPRNSIIAPIMVGEDRRKETRHCEPVRTLAWQSRRSSGCESEPSGTPEGPGDCQKVNRPEGPREATLGCVGLRPPRNDVFSFTCSAIIDYNIFPPNIPPFGIKSPGDFRIYSTGKARYSLPVSMPSTLAADMSMSFARKGSAWASGTRISSSTSAPNWVSRMMPPQAATSSFTRS